MKKAVWLSPLLVIALMMLGCTADDPGFTTNVGDSRVKLADTDRDLLTIDEASRSLTTITFAHHEVHEGDAYLADFADEALGDDDTIILVFRTPPIAKVHLLTEFSTLLGGDLEVWEGVTWNVNTGTLVPIINRNREAPMNVSGLLEDKTATPTFTATSNILANITGLNTGSAISVHRHFAWGKKGLSAAGGVRETEEILLKISTQYAIVFTADGANNKAQILLDWYEHIDLD